MDGTFTPGGILALAELAVLVFGGLWLGPRAIKVATLRAQLREKDAVIRTREQTNEALESRLDVLEADLDDMRTQIKADRAKITELERDVTDYRARYEEMQRFAAPEALAEVSKQITDGLAQSAADWAPRWERVAGVLERIDHRLDTEHA